MITIFHVKSLNQPDLTPYRTLRQPVEHFRNGLFVAEGEKVVRRLLESQHEIISALLTSEWLEKYHDFFSHRPESINIFIGEKEFLESIVGFNLHQGIMALGKIPVQANINSVLANSMQPHLLVAIDGLTNSENIGVLVRNCVAFGAQCILAGKTSSSPYLRRAVRNSMGTVFKIPVVHCENLVATLTKIKQDDGIKIIGAHPHSEEHNIQNGDFSGDCCFVFGSEGEGISPEVLSICDTTTAIPMQLGVDSLNVASASAVFLYEVTRQRNYP